MSAKEKLQSAIESMLEKAEIPGAYKPIIKSLIANYMKNVTNEDIVKIVTEIQTVFIPWLLEIE